MSEDLKATLERQKAKARQEAEYKVHCYLAECIEKYVGQDMTQDDAGQLFENLGETMQEICGGTVPYEVEPPEEITWKKLYPGFFMRLKARFAARMLRWGWWQTEKLRWYHAVFPFTVEAVMDHEEDIPVLRISLKRPGGWVFPIYICPVTPAKYITLTLEV